MNLYLYGWFVGICLIFMNTDTRINCIGQEEKVCAPNTISLNSKICIGLTEVPNYMYKDFLQSISDKEGKSSQTFLDMLPDFESWGLLFKEYSIEDLKRSFFSSDDLALMPIVGISYEQAVAFTEWRTEDFKRQLSEMNKRDRAMYPINFRFRLPTKKEWGYMRFRGLDKSMKKKLRKMGDKNQKAFKLSKSDLLTKNELIHDIYYRSDERVGFFNMYNNVAEMTLQKGQALGGSWQAGNPTKDHSKVFSYKGKNAWTGFRCIFEILD